MKKFKLSVLCAAMMMMLGFTSCLDSGEPGPSQLTSFLKVRNSMGFTTFEDPSGFQYVPTKTLTTSPTSRLAFLYFQIDANALPEDAKSADVTLLQDPVYLREMPVALTAVPENAGTVGLYSLPSNGVAIWGGYEFMILSPAFTVEKGTTTSKLKKHTFRVYYDAAEEGVSSGTLRLHLRYEIDADKTDEDWGKDYNQLYSEYIFVDMQSIIASYRSHNQNQYPTRLEVEYEMFNAASASDNESEKRSQTITLDSNYLPNMSTSEE